MNGLSLTALTARPRVTIGWRTNHAPAWEFDLDAIVGAAEQLGVRSPILVGCAEYANGRWAGMHSFEGGAHRVRVGRRESARDASRTLWHELTHCAQHDRGVEMGTRAIRRDLGDQAYRNDPREREARANEPRADTHPLVLEAMA